MTEINRTLDKTPKTNDTDEQMPPDLREQFDIQLEKFKSSKKDSEMNDALTNPQALKRTSKQIIADRNKQARISFLKNVQ